VVGVGSARLLSLTDAGHYALIVILMIAAANCFQVAFAPLIVRHFAESRTQLLASSKHCELLDLRLAFLVCASLLVSCIWFVRAVVAQWAGVTDDPSATGLASFCFVTMHVAGMGPAAMLQGLSKFGALARASVENAFIHIGVALFGAHYFGLDGLIYGSAISAVLQYVNLSTKLLPESRIYLVSIDPPSSGQVGRFAHLTHLIAPALPLVVSNMLQGVAQVHSTQMVLVSLNAYANLAFLAGAQRLRQIPDLVQTNLLVPLVPEMISSRNENSAARQESPWGRVFVLYLCRSVVLMNMFGLIVSFAPQQIMTAIYGPGFEGGAEFLIVAGLQGQSLAVFVPISFLFVFVKAFRIQTLYALSLSIGIILSAWLAKYSDNALVRFFVYQVSVQMALGWFSISWAILAKLVPKLPVATYAFLVLSTIAVSFGLLAVCIGSNGLAAISRISTGLGLAFGLYLLMHYSVPRRTSVSSHVSAPR
jgi:hypothetical protein